MFALLPPFTLLLGLAGILPFAICGIAAVSATVPAAWISALLGYGAVILAFLGGVHWGLVLTDETAPLRDERLVLGVVPSLLGWAALLSTMILPPEVGLGILIAGFVGTLATEVRWARAGLVPGPYMALRWVLSLAVIAILTTVLVLLLVGARLVF